MRLLKETGWRSAEAIAEEHLGLDHPQHGSAMGPSASLAAFADLT